MNDLESPGSKSRRLRPNTLLNRIAIDSRAASMTNPPRSIDTRLNDFDKVRAISRAEYFSSR
jgi:hypothetical protein